MKKYKLLEPRKSDGLRRIKYLTDMSEHGIIAGNLGGLLSGYHNLSQEGRCAVLSDAIVYGEAQVSENALVCGGAFVHGRAKIFGYAQVYGRARVCGRAIVCGKAHVAGYAHLTYGEWRRTPLVITMTPYDVSEDGDGLIRVGCQLHTYKQWMEHGLDIAEADAMSQPMIEMYHRAIEYIHAEAEVQR